MSQEKNTVTIDLEFLKQKIFEDDYMSPDEAEYIFACVMQAASEGSGVDFKECYQETIRLSASFHTAKMPHATYEDCRNKADAKPRIRQLLKTGLGPIPKRRS